jgi:type III pantothenate kinase
MFLVADIGNTSLKWAYGNRRGIVHKGGVRHSDPSEREQCIRDIPKIGPVERILVCNVADERKVAWFIDLISDVFHGQVEFVRSEESKLGVHNGYSSPELLGADRWVALITLSVVYGRPGIVVDCGTAITVDGLSSSGQHIGGVIGPGLMAMKKSLLKSAHQIDTRLSLNAGSKVDFASKNTDDAIDNGIKLSAIGFVDGVLDGMADMLGQNVKVVITGGDASLLHPLLKNETIHDPDLLLRGLLLMAEETL